MRTILAALIASLALAPVARAQPVDLELVLAVDVSRSMDADEQRLQREGYADALTHPAVLAAIRSGPLGRIALAYVEWAGPWAVRVILDPTLIGTEADAREAADWLRAQPLESASGTSISAGLKWAAALIDASPFKGARRVIDVSGDGPNNTGDPVHHVRDWLVGRGFEINGLPILLKRPEGFFTIPDLDRYYEDCVIGGPGAFILPVREKSQFATAIRMKMVLEIAGLMPPPRIRPVRATDCMVGEKLRRRWLDLRNGE